MRKIRLNILVLLVMVNIVTGCGIAGMQETNTNLENTAGDPMEQSTAIYPIKIKHAFGESVIENKPSRVVAISQGNVDVALALGVVPIATFKAN